MTTRPVCPECATPVEVDWEWCHGCGFDPEGKLAEARAQGLEPPLLAPRQAVSPAAAFPGAPASSASTSASPVSDLPAPPPPPPDDAVSPLSAPVSWDDESWGDDLLVSTGPGDVQQANGSDGSNGSNGSNATFASVDELDGDQLVDRTAERDHPYSPFDLRGLDVSAEPEADASSFDLSDDRSFDDRALLADVPTPAETDPGPSSAASGGFSPSGWQNDPPPPKPEGALNPKAGGPKTPVLIVLGVLAVLVVGFVFVKMGSSDRSKVADNPNGPPPPGALSLNTTPSTVPPITVAAGWVEYRSPDGRFIAGFPVAPQQKNVFVTIGKRTLPAVEVGAQEGPFAPAFAVDTIEVPTDLSIPDAQAAFDGLAQHFQVTSSEPYSANGLDGIRFTATSNGADLTGLVYVRGSRLYYLVGAGADPTSFDQFASSFQLPTGR